MPNLTLTEKTTQKQTSHIVEYATGPPLTMINDTAASLNDVLFPSVAICNINQVRVS